MLMGVESWDFDKGGGNKTREGIILSGVAVNQKKEIGTKKEAKKGREKKKEKKPYTKIKNLISQHRVTLKRLFRRNR